MTTGGCGCAATLPPTSMTGGGYIQHRGGSLLLSDIVNLAIPIGFVLARNAIGATIKNKNTSSSPSNHRSFVGGGGNMSDVSQRLQKLSFRINRFLAKQDDYS